MAQGPNNRNQQGNQQRGDNQSRRVISLKSLTEETVAGGARRALLQARVESGKRPFSGEPLTLTSIGPTGASIQFGAFIEAATQLAHWTVEIPARQERVYRVTDGDGSISIPVTVRAAAVVLAATAALRSDGAYELVVSVKTEDGFGVPGVPVSVQCGGPVREFITDNTGRCTHAIALGGKYADVLVESPGLKSWSTRLFSQAIHPVP